MSTVQLIGGRPAVDDGPALEAPDAKESLLSAPRVIAGGLLLVVLYAAFDHGAVTLYGGARIEVAVAALAALGGAGLVWTGRIRLAAPRGATVGTGLLLAFACWSAISLLWSVSPDQTWVELNRALCYALVLVLAIAIGSTLPGAVELIGKGFLAIAVAVTVYALGQKLLPGIRIDGLINLDQSGPLPRLQEPLGYWNALALFLVMGVPIALALTVDRGRTAHARLASAGVLSLMLLTIPFTYSRGGLLALAVALVVAIAAGRERLRSSAWLGLVVLATLPPLVFGLASHPLASVGTSLASREGAGAVLSLLVLASLATLVIAGRRLLVSEERIRIEPRRQPGLRRLAWGTALVLVLGALLAATVSSRGLTGTFSHAWSGFTASHAADNSDPGRLLSADSGNRWVWWKEAAGAFSDRPLGGWGAGSFGVVQKLYQPDDRVPVAQPHSVPIQFLAETGLVGALLAVAAFVLLLRAAAGAVARSRLGSERLLAAALLAGTLAYVVHSFYDWDWDIPAVSLPALLFLGVLVGARRVGAAASRWSSAGRLMLLAVVTLWLCAFALSAALPSLASDKASAALVEASSGSAAALAQAQAEAAQATRMDPLSDAGLRVEATIAVHRGDLRTAIVDLLAAVRRDPSDEQAWQDLTSAYFLESDATDGIGAEQRAVALDPHGSFAQSVIQSRLRNESPRSSATAVATPLPSR